jgi:hypothetical protein
MGLSSRMVLRQAQHERGFCSPPTQGSLILSLSKDAVTIAGSTP